MIKKQIFLFVFLIVIACSAEAQKILDVSSPNGRIKAIVKVSKTLSYEVRYDNDVVIAPSSISMTVSTGESFGVNAAVKNVKRRQVDQTINTTLYKRTKIKDQYNETILNFKGDYAVIFRAYDDGVAYRFTVSRRNNFTVESEEASFEFAEDYNAVIPYVANGKPTYEEQFWNSFENTYTATKLSGMDNKRLAFLPLVVELPKGRKVCITEADLEEYPGMYLANPTSKKSLKGVFAPYPKVIEQGGHNELQLLVKERETFIAKAKGSRAFPWRVIIISNEDKQLVDNDMVYKLASSARFTDMSWIKPGKVAWDWWNDWNIYGVDFRAGVNNETYKYYIDFAAAHNIEYVILDEGWAVNLKSDLMQVVPSINIPELVEYGKQKNVGIILWAGYSAFDRDMEKVCAHYSQLGVKGFKIDFMDRDDQVAVDFYYRAAKVTSKFNLLADFHGAYKPTGLQRTYPNVINFEGVHGLEQLKWSSSETDMVKYDVTIPFIRMVAGPMDYTQGAMRNAVRDNFRPINSEPMSQGTRCHQLAEYVIFEAPLTMLCDNPSSYSREEECTKFITSMPTVWDNTIALESKMGEYVSIARQKGKDWYVGTLTNWNSRDLIIDVSFLGNGNFKVELFKDGINADRVGRDYKHEIIDLGTERKLKVSMAPGGGYIARIYQE